MRILKNTGGERVVDELRRSLTGGSSLDIATPGFSLFAFGELQAVLRGIGTARLVVPDEIAVDDGLFGGEADRSFRNRLTGRWLAARSAEWLRSKASVRGAEGALTQSVILTDHSDPERQLGVTGACSFSTEGLGVTPGNRFSLVQASEGAEEWGLLKGWFDGLWNGLTDDPSIKARLLDRLDGVAAHQAPEDIYFAILWNLFRDLGDELDEERIMKSATGIRDTHVWNKLYPFQRDGVLGAIDKLERIGGCIIADSVGLGKTFEALAVIKYYELRNDRVLVLCPKRLRDNWTLYKTNDRRNSLATDRFNYDVLNHTDLSRSGGQSGDIDLAYVNWGNYDLVVIDESHNFRNKSPHKERETRYDHLMNRIIKSGVKTKVLMLSATPVNNRLADLKNQIAFVTEGYDAALRAQGIASIDTTVRLAQGQFNRWLELDEERRKPALLMEMLGFDYFKLLDLLTIARSRKHIERYYGLKETGQFPERRKPINIKSDVDLARQFPPIRDINNDIRRLKLGAYAPLRYVLPEKQRAYDEKYSTQVRGGESVFRQADREESLVHLLRVNLLKRMESSVASFALSIQRQLRDVEGLLAKIDAHSASVDELSIDDIEIDDPAFELLLIGNKVKVLLNDVDRVRWRQDLAEDRDRLAELLRQAQEIIPNRDAKLAALREAIAKKVAEPDNPGNRKIIVFTAFADTAAYLYGELAPWATKQLGLHSALVTGSGGNRTTLPGIRTDLGGVLTAFSPRSKERPADMAGEGEIDLLIATDCISEGQNLQDCDYLVNYDIHWNPVRIIQRFGRIDRIGSTNATIQLVNFWPNMELNEYINLEQRVSGRMVLLDISATGEENVIEHQSGDQMNDLEYRRKQLEKLQNTVIDLEDLSSGVSIADLTLNDFRIDLSGHLKTGRDRLEALPPGAYAVVQAAEIDAAVPPGAIFCLRAVGDGTADSLEPGYPLAPHVLVHVGADGAVLLPFTQAKQILDRLKKVALGRSSSDVDACNAFDRATRQGQDMASYQRLLGAAVASVIGKKEERAVESLFSPGGTHAKKGEFQGVNDFEVVAFVALLPRPDESAA
jgi:SNF2 family DNA or RNA helicase